MNAKTDLSATQRHALLTHPAGWIAIGFGAGLAPRAQGTVGSALALLPWLWLRHLSLPYYALMLVVTFAIGVWACDVSGRRIRFSDHRALVWDEFVGQWIALLPLLLPALLPASGFRWWMVVTGFVLFRLFDVWKPWPISWLDARVKGGMGVMVDDVVAGIFAAIALAGILYSVGYLIV